LWDAGDINVPARLMCCVVVRIFANFYRSRLKAHLAAAATVLVLAGCALLPPKQDQTRLIVLSSVGSTDATGSELPGREKFAFIAIGLGPVHLPEYIDRPELVIRTSPNGLDLSRTDRWAEPLTDNFRHVLASDLTNLLGTSNIVQFPWYPGTRLDFVVQMQVLRFEADTSRKAELVASWELRTGQNTQVLVTREAHLTQLATSLAGDAVAGALSKDIAELAEQISMAIVEAEEQRIARGRR
jgi:uncharacterized lipoprotein YmbA